MVCYIVPLVATLFCAGGRKALGKHGQNSLLLNIMLLGGSLFGFVDHMWNGELFIISGNIASDLVLGGTITLSIFASWGLLVSKDKITQRFGFLSRKTGILQQ